ncbi:hypothetical protein NQZ68_000690, partial [Dissostichus eleginoides]
QVRCQIEGSHPPCRLSAASLHKAAGGVRGNTGREAEGRGGGERGGVLSAAEERKREKVTTLPPYWTSYCGRRNCDWCDRWAGSPLGGSGGRCCAGGGGGCCSGLSHWHSNHGLSVWSSGSWID